MEQADPDALVRRFVDDDLPDEAVRDALHRIADDAEARDLLQFEVRMTRDLAVSRRTSPPDGFVDDTMDALPVSSQEEAFSIAAWLRALWRRLQAPVSFRVRPLSAATVALLAGLIAWTAWPERPLSSAPASRSTKTTEASGSSSVQATRPSSPASGRETVWVRFLYTNNTADSVAVAGDFNQWTPTPLTPHTVNGRTVWTGLVPVSPGEHEYQFVINGDRWIPDPLAPTKQQDGFGSKNAVLKV